MAFYLIGPFMGYGTKMEPLLALGIAAVWAIYGGIYFVRASKSMGRTTLVAALLRSPNQHLGKARVRAGASPSGLLCASHFRVARIVAPGGTINVEFVRRQRFTREVSFPVALQPDLEPSSMLEVEFAQISDVGRVREGNEDYIGYFQPETPEQAQTHGWLFALADGVGGHQQGEVASKTAIESLISCFPLAKRGESCRL